MALNSVYFNCCCISRQMKHLLVLKQLMTTFKFKNADVAEFLNTVIIRGGSKDSLDGGLSYEAIFSIIDGINCNPKAVLACRSGNLVFISFSI